MNAVNFIVSSKSWCDPAFKVFVSNSFLRDNQNVNPNNKSKLCAFSC